MKAKETVKTEVKTTEKAETKVPAKTAVKAAKTPAKTAVKADKTPAKKVPAKKAEVKANVTLQFDGKSYTQTDLLKIAKDVWKYDLKKKVGDLKSVDLYVKPEENTCYYVINGEVVGSFVL